VHSFSDQLHSAGVKAVRDDDGNDGPSSFETPEMNFTSEFITSMHTITGIVRASFVSFQNHYIFPHENQV